MKLSLLQRMMALALFAGVAVSAIGLLGLKSVVEVSAQDTKPRDPDDYLSRSKLIPYPPDSLSYGSFRVYDKCEVIPEQRENIRLRMVLYRVQESLFCEGEVVNESIAGGIKRVTILFRGRQPKDAFIGVFERKKLVYIVNSFPIQ